MLTLQKKFLSQFHNKISLQFDVEEFIRPLVSSICESSEEDIEVDSTSVIVTEQEQDADSDIEVIACYKEAPIYPPNLVVGRVMTFDLDTCGEERTQPLYRPSGSIGSTLDPSARLTGSWEVHPLRLIPQVIPIMIWLIVAGLSQ